MNYVAAMACTLPDYHERRRRVLVVDDDAPLRALLELALVYEGYEVVRARSAGEALMLLESHEVDLIVSDYHMPGASGIDLLGAVRRNGSTVPFVIITGSQADRCARAATGLRVAAVLEKPFPLAEFRAAVAKALGRRMRHERRRAVRPRAGQYQPDPRF